MNGVAAYLGGTSTIEGAGDRWTVPDRATGAGHRRVL